MSLRLYFTGHRSFANHGCEALIRSAAALFREAFGDVTLLVPSADADEDRRFWPDAAAHGVTFVPVVDPWAGHRWWDRAVRRVPGWDRLPWPRGPLAPGTRTALDGADMLVSTGGDNYALDYGLVSLLTMMAVDGAAMDRGLPTVLWGASVGPFDGAPAPVQRAVSRHLRRFDLVVARETLSQSWLQSQGVDGRLALACDPAFTLKPEPVALTRFWPKEGGKGTVAVNLSPLIARTHAAGNPHGRSLEEEAGAFITGLVNEGYGVLLLPHVVGQSGSRVKCDHALLSSLTAHTGTAGGRIAVAPRTLNAPQLKHALSRCRYVLAARTHATIGALSSGVPTISIAYSLKAKGINRDLFGDARYVLDGAAMTAASLRDALARLEADEGDIRRLLAARKLDWPESLQRALDRLKRCPLERGRAEIAAAY